MSDNGKGSARRGTSKEEMKRYEDNYEAIFGKPRKKAVCEKIEVVEMGPEDQALADKLGEALRRMQEREESETPKES